MCRFTSVVHNINSCYISSVTSADPPCAQSNCYPLVFETYQVHYYYTNCGLPHCVCGCYDLQNNCVKAVVPGRSL